LPEGPTVAEMPPLSRILAASTGEAWQMSRIAEMAIDDLFTMNLEGELTQSWLLKVQ
jgi:hypothetical protein